MRAIILTCFFLTASTLAAQGTVIAVYNSSARLDVIDPTSGATLSQQTLTSGGTILGMTGLAQDPTTGTLYVVVRSGPTSSATSLGTVDRTAGTISIITALSQSISGIQFDDAGTLWAVSGESGSGTSNPESMFTVNKTTGALTLQFALGNGDSGEAIGFDPGSNTMVHWSGRTTQAFETVNLGTGGTSGITHNFPATTTLAGFGYDSNSDLFWVSGDGALFGSMTTSGTYSSIGTMFSVAKGIVVLPTIDPSVTSLPLGTTTQGTPGTPASFDLAGYNLLGDVTITAPAGVELSTSAGGTYSGVLNVPRSTAAGQLNTTQVFVRITASASVGSFTSDLDLTVMGGDDVQITVTGQVNSPPTPEMDVAAGATAIADGGTDAIGTVTPGATSRTYTISNTGGTDLSLSGTPTILLTPVANVTGLAVSAAPTSPIASSGSTMFTVDYTVSGNGPFSFTISIDNNDPNENPYNWTVSGTGQTPVPEMDVARGTSAVADGGTDTLGSGQPVSGIPLVYTITNSGSATLNITTPVTVSGETNCTVSVTSQPSNTVATTGATTLELTVTPSSDGAFSFMLSITNDDSDENPYDWAVSGTASSGGGSGNGGDDDGGCSTGDGAGFLLLLVLIAAVAAPAIRHSRR